jgi:Tfp pilus assembly protein PilF
VLARGLLVKGGIRRAEAIVKFLLTRVDKAPTVHVLDGNVKLAQQNSKGARAAFERARGLQADNIEALSGLTRLDLMERKPADAETRLDLLLQRAPKNAELQILAARLKATLKKSAEAEALLRKAIDNDPSAFRAYSLLGQLYVSERRLDEARSTFEQLAAKRPDSVAANTIVAMIYDAQNNRAESRKRYERILQLDPRAAVAANNLAWIYAEDGGNLDVALQLAQTAKERMPEIPEVDDTLGWIYYKKNLASLAVPPLERAAAKDPSNPGYQYHLGMAYMKAGNREKARKTLEHALTLKPDLPEAAEVRAALRSQ